MVELKYTIGQNISTIGQDTRTVWYNTRAIVRDRNVSFNGAGFATHMWL